MRSLLFVEFFYDQKDDPPDDKHPRNDLHRKKCFDQILEDKAYDGQGEESDKKFLPEGNFFERDFFFVEKQNRQDRCKLDDHLIGFRQMILGDSQELTGHDHMPS